MPEERDRTNRRTVLRATAAVLGGVALGATSASARLDPGDSARVTTTAPPYLSACPARNRTGSLDGGVQGRVLQTCTDSGDTKWAYFSPGQTILPAYWNRAAVLDAC